MKMSRMIAVNNVRLAAFLVAAALAAPAAAHPGAGAPGPPQGSVTSAQELYAAARYEEALALLNAVRPAEPGERLRAAQYRALCLLALGRRPEAEGAIADVVSGDPLFSPSEADASPRVRAAFGDVRRRLLPEIIVARYETAKAAYDRSDWGAAVDGFRTVLALIDDRDNPVTQTDLRLLAAGFLELTSRAAAPPAPEPQLPIVPPAAPAPSATQRAASSSAPDRGRIYTGDDAGVVPPVGLKQEFPAVPAGVIGIARSRGLLELVVDEQGRVASIVIRRGIHAAYDTLLLSAAGHWKYTPATLNGVPVRFRRLVQVAVRK